MNIGIETLQPLIIGKDFNKYTLEKVVQHYDKFALNYAAHEMTLLEFLYSYHKYENKDIFIKPSAADKPFNGLVLNKSTKYKFDADLTSYNPNLSTKVYVGEAYNITREFRCIICDGEIITTTCYCQYNKVVRIDVNDDKLYEYIKKVIVLYKPDDIFVIDICECDGEFYVLELGMFSCCGIYTKHINYLVKALHDYYLNK